MGELNSKNHKHDTLISPNVSERLKVIIDTLSADIPDLNEVRLAIGEAVEIINSKEKNLNFHELLIALRSLSVKKCAEKTVAGGRNVESKEITKNINELVQIIENTQKSIVKGNIDSEYFSDRQYISGTNTVSAIIMGEKISISKKHSEWDAMQTLEQVDNSIKHFQAIVTSNDIAQISSFRDEVKMIFPGYNTANRYIQGILWRAENNEKVIELTDSDLELPDAENVGITANDIVFEGFESNIRRDLIASRRKISKLKTPKREISTCENTRVGIIRKAV